MPRKGHCVAPSGRYVAYGSTPYLMEREPLTVKPGPREQHL